MDVQRFLLTGVQTLVSVPDTTAFLIDKFLDSLGHPIQRKFQALFQCEGRASVKMCLHSPFTAISTAMTEAEAMDVQRFLLTGVQTLASVPDTTAFLIDKFLDSSGHPIHAQV